MAYRSLEQSLSVRRSQPERIGLPSVRERADLRRLKRSTDVIRSYGSQTTTVFSRQRELGRTMFKAYTARITGVCDHELTTCALVNALAVDSRYHCLDVATINRAADDVQVHVR